MCVILPRTHISNCSFCVNVGNGAIIVFKSNVAFYVCVIIYPKYIVNLLLSWNLAASQSPENLMQCNRMYIITSNLLAAKGGNGYYQKTRVLLLFSLFSEGKHIVCSVSKCECFREPTRVENALAIQEI